MPIPNHKEIFKNNYNPSLLGLACWYVETKEKIATYKQHLAFNLRTKGYSLTPFSLRVRSLVSMQKGRDIARRISNRFLGAWISQNVRKNRGLEHNSWFQRQQLCLSPWSWAPSKTGQFHRAKKGHNNGNARHARRRNSTPRCPTLERKHRHHPTVGG